MVWIQGGMFEIQSSVPYDGSCFARDGVVCVVINWRVGAEGFLYLGDGTANLGLLDQVAALEWVRDNIAAFGGDPANVTIFGESAGAMSIGTLLSMPRAVGLFRRAIAQSGAAHQVLPAGTARRIGRYLAEKLSTPPTREAIAAVRVERLLQAQAELKAELLAHPDPQRWGQEVVTSMLPWQPVIEGDVIPGPPIDRIAAGAGAQVDVLVGTNTDDWKLFLVITGAIDQITDQILTGPVDVYGPGQRPSAARGVPGGRPAAGARRHHARRLSLLRHQRRPGLADIRPEPQGHHALRHDLAGGGRSPILGTGTVGRRPLVSAGRPRSGYQEADAGGSDGA